MQDSNTLLRKGAKASVTEGAKGTDVSISTHNLQRGTYYAYSVDEKGNVSSKGTNKIVVKDKDAQ